MIGWQRVVMVVLAALSIGARAEVAVPAHEAWVTDLASALSVEQRQTLEARLAQFTADKGAQIAVLLVPSTDGEAIESFALRVAETWKLGRQGIDDGALLVLATNDRRLRIEVGYGLEGALPDAIAKRIIAEVIVPQLKAGNIAAGVIAGVDSMLKVIDGEPLPAPSIASAPSIDAIQIAFFIAVFFAMLFRGRTRTHPLRGLLAAASSAGVTYLLTDVAFAAAISGFAAIVIAGLTGGSSNGRSSWASHRRYGGPGGWGGGGYGGGGFGGGGGGSFGGGGASGSW